MNSPNNQASLIWNIADILRGGWKQHEYQDVILPLVVLKRLDSVLADTKQSVLRKYQKIRGQVSEEGLAPLLEKESGSSYFNVSSFDFEKLLDDSESIYANFVNYLDGYSANVRDIIDKFDFQKQLQKLKGGKLLHLVIKELDKVDLSPKSVSNHDMGYIFEELIRKFNEQSNETAGEHYTPREVIGLMVRLLLEADKEHIQGESRIIEIYDPTCGTGGMLTIGKDYMQENINPNAEVLLYGQELNPQTYAITKSDILIKGEDADRIRGGSGDHSKDSTLSNDQFYGKTFDYVIANPPYGVDWKKDRDVVEAEAARGNDGRFPAGLPSVSDGQMLFLQHMLSKMRPVQDGGGRMAVVHNASPLFTGKAGRGPSDIRKWLIENDYLEAIIALPTNMFYNTDIPTYIWVLSNRKSDDRRGKVQLVDASGIYHKLRKNLGKKNKEFTEEDISNIYEVYANFKDSEKSKIFKTKDFGYTQVTVIWNEDSSKRKDTENIPLNEDIDEYFKREVLPHQPSAKMDRKKDRIGYEILFNRYFYKYKPPRGLKEINDDLRVATKEVLGLLDEIMG